MIYHIAKLEDWEKAKGGGSYFVESLEKEGFIHCSNKDQVVDVANDLFKGKSGLVLLVVDEGKLSSKVVFEDL